LPTRLRGCRQFLRQQRNTVLIFLERLFCLLLAIRYLPGLRRERWRILLRRADGVEKSQIYFVVSDLLRLMRQQLFFRRSS